MLSDASGQNRFHARTSKRGQGLFSSWRQSDLTLRHPSVNLVWVKAPRQALPRRCLVPPNIKPFRSITGTGRPGDFVAHMGKNCRLHRGVGRNGE